MSQLVDGVALSSTSAVPGPDEPGGQLLQLPKAVYGTGTLAYALTRQERVEAPSVPLRVGIVEVDANVLVVERAGRAAACRLHSGVPVDLRLTAQGADGCDGLPVPSKWAEAVGRRCLDLACVSFAAYRVDDDGDESRLAWRRVPVDTSPDRVALLVDGVVVASGGHGWLRVEHG